MIDLETLKQHLNIDAEFTADDDYIESLEEVAMALVERHIDRSLDDLADGDSGDIPAPLLHAICLMVGNFYANRESVSYANTTVVPMSLDYILGLYRDYDNANI